MSLSLQNTMANFAGGVLVLFLKPFKAGDYIVTKDGEGTGGVHRTGLYDPSDH